MTPASLPLWLPYCGPGATPEDLWARWNLDPFLLLALGLGFLALMRLRRGDAPGRIRTALGFGVLLIIFVSPLCALSSALFSARTVHHVLLVAGAAPLLAWRPPLAGRWSLPTATLSAAGVFWAWHAPGAYSWALSNDAAYWVMQSTLLGSALWFWGAASRARPVSAVAALLVSTIQMGLLGALLTFADWAVYAPHAATTLAWGLSPLEDQQAAGLIMWAPAASIYLACALAVLGRILEPKTAAGAP